VCLSVCEHISGTTCAIVTNVFVHVAYGRGSVLLLWERDIENALCGPYSGMNFAMKDRFGLNLLIYREVGQSLISYY